MRPPRELILTIAGAILFAVAGFACRLHWRAFYTRWQIAAFVLAAAAVEGGRWFMGERPSVRRWLLMSAAAAIAITTAKFVVEPWALRPDAAAIGVAIPKTQ